MDQDNHCLTLTFLAKVTFASLNGADKDVDNINPIKKITLANGKQLPYMSSQALRRALRDQLAAMGNAPSPVAAGKETKGPSVTKSDPAAYVDDDLFGYMDASARKQRTSPVRVEALVALTPYQGDLDFGTNYQGGDQGREPNIFESEIHSGTYRGTVLIELDRIGVGYTDGSNVLNTDPYIDPPERARRTKLLIDALRMLWSSGRQSRFLADITPKFVAAAWMSAKAPIYLEAVQERAGTVNIDELAGVVKDYEPFIAEHVFAVQGAAFNVGSSEGGQDGEASTKTHDLATGFTEIKSWVDRYYGVKA